ncbi:hypothetical protein [Nitrosospira sp. NRS527]|uniref:hypothetical protein n=1 Tax=Nitrosospira sp. NRS527 TaxID=155925 RepID=UPI001AF69FE4|nr:hypothetical protein [Nitrosospira sp. NRS527]BCT68620.1 hypothetical protein NNRS527_02224 [Nitrosospira sp. NRS527]
MDEFAFARVVHVLGVVLWIGGVAMVTTVLIPAMAQMRSASERTEFFARIEGRFAPQARFVTLLVGLSGFYMVHFLNAWSRFAELGFWWMHAMVLVWLIFTLMLFVVEPLVLRKQAPKTAQHDAEKTFRRMRRMHWILLGLSLVTIAGAVAGSHGWMLSGE